MRRLSRLLLIPVILLASTIFAATNPARATETGAACVDAVELETVRLINDYRLANGRGRLAITQTLTAASEGINWSQNMTNHGYTYNTWRGENIAGGQSSAPAVFDAWRNSPGHNSAMLSANFNAIGIGLVVNTASTYGRYWTTDFGGYVDAPAMLCGGGTAPVLDDPTIVPTPTPAPSGPTADTTAPTVTIAAPATVRNGSWVRVKASDAGAGVVRVGIRYCPGTSCDFASGTPLAGSPDFVAPYRLRWTGQPAKGIYTLVAKAVDGTGNVGYSSPVTVTVANK